MTDLRQKLKKLTQCYDLESQLVLMDDLRKKFNHHIKLRERIDSNSNLKYNCFMYALNVSQSEEVKNALQQNEDISFGSRFIQRLINNRILLPSQSGTIILYFRQDKVVHAGKFSHIYKRVISKWGKGHLWEHDIFEVPSLYGDIFKLFDSATSQVVINEFQEFITKEQNSR